MSQVGSQDQMGQVETPLSLYPNIETLGVTLKGLNLPKAAELMYRQSGETTWRTGHPLVRITDGRWLYLIVIDRRETSIAATFSEVADLPLSYSVHTGMALDGGGSSTLVIEGVDRLPHLLNTPVNQNTPKRERAVANHLGSSLKR